MNKKITSFIVIALLTFSHTWPIFAQSIDTSMNEPSGNTTPSANTTTDDTSSPEAKAETPITTVCVGATIDSDGDGVCDNAETGGEDPSTTNTTDSALPDTDGDGTPNYLDTDDDGDGIPTATEDTTSTGEQALVDSDGDSVPDYLEPNTVDTDKDGITNNLDPDDDGDTVPTSDDGTITNDPVAPVDTDADGIPNYLDSNDDGDAIPTANEETATTTNPVATDTDSDTIPDYLEPNTTDTDKDGIANIADPDDDGDTIPTALEVITDTSDTDAAVDEIIDTDNDGTPNALDSDDDGDGIPTVSEDTNRDGSVMNDDVDGDGVPNFEEPNNIDTDKDGITNNLDVDDDGDGVVTKTETNLDEAVSETKDGILADTDGDDIPNYLDTDDDGDGISTIKEDLDKDKNPTDDDTDQDGIADYLESNTVNRSGGGSSNYRNPDDDSDGILTKLDSNPYSDSCYAPSDISYELFVSGPTGKIFETDSAAKKTVLASDVIRFDFDINGDGTFGELGIRVIDIGHRSIIATVMNSSIGSDYSVHLRILGGGAVEKDTLLWKNASAAANVPKKIQVSDYIEVCGDSANYCPAYITEYMRLGANNDPAEVSKLQSFLSKNEGDTTLPITGIFDQATDAAVRSFQEKHSSVILGPWAIPSGTGYVYRTTSKRINDLYCAAKQP